MAFKLETMLGRQEYNYYIFDKTNQINLEL